MPLYPMARLAALEAKLTAGAAVRKAPLVLQSQKLALTTSGTSEETIDTHTFAAGLFAADGDMVEMILLLDQTAANACTAKVTLPGTGGDILSDARSTTDDRTIRLTLRRQSATTLRCELHYRYGDGTDYNPDSVVATVSDLAANACTVVLKFTTGVAAGNLSLVGKLVTYYPAVA